MSLDLSKFKKPLTAEEHDLTMRPTESTIEEKVVFSEKSIKRISKMFSAFKKPLIAEEHELIMKH